MKKKILIIGIFVGAILVMFSSSPALDVDIQNKDKGDIEQITLITGYPYSGELIGIGIFRELTIRAPTPGIEYIYISIFKRIDGRFKLIEYQEEVSYVHSPSFIGFYHDGGLTDINKVFGIAIGEIQWS